VSKRKEQKIQTLKDLGTIVLLAFSFVLLAIVGTIIEAIGLFIDRVFLGLDSTDGCG